MRLFSPHRKPPVEPSRLPSEEEGRAPRFTIDIEGRGRIAEISASARRMPWMVSVLQVLWVAGPATFLAMQGAYWLGFGEFAPLRNVIYFAFFTLFTGMIGLATKFVSTTVVERRTIQAAEQLRRTIDFLPDLLFAIRDIDLAADSVEVRRRRSAGILLQEMDLDPETLALAVRDICGDSSLAQTAQQIEVYRRVGLPSRVRDLVESSHEARLAALERVHAESPELADLLRDRLSGRVPSQDAGIPRREDFLQRLLAAADQEDPEALPVEDVLELLTLMFELVNGREIRYLHFRWKGSWDVARALEKVEVTRTRYRLAQLRFDCRLRGLALSLVTVDGPLQRSDLQRSGLALGHRVLLALESLLAKRPPLDSLAGRQLGRWLRVARVLREDHERLQQAGPAFDAALARWERKQQRVQAGHRSAMVWRWLRWRGPGLQIQEDLIAFRNDQKLAFAAEFCRFLEDRQIQLTERGLLQAGQVVDREEVRRLGLALLPLLENTLDLSDLAIQRAIQASPAAWLGGLQAGMSADTRAGLGAAVVKEVRQDLGRMAERLAAQLVTLYQLPLAPRLCRQLEERYGANRERLGMLAERGLPGSVVRPMRRIQNTERDELMQHPRWALLLKLGARYADAGEEAA
jgi:hypothetical protein